MAKKKDDKASKTSRARVVDQSRAKATLILAYKASGGILREACEAAGVSMTSHRNWYTTDDNYRVEFEKARLAILPVIIQRCEQLSEDIITKVLEMGVDKAPKHLLNAALSEIQYKRSTIGKADYSTKVINEVKVDETDKATWEDVVATLQAAAKAPKDKEADR